MSVQRAWAGIGVGSAIGAFLWVHTRNQERDQLQRLISEDPKLKILQGAATFIAVPEDLQLLVDGKISEYVDTKIKYTNTLSAEEAYKEVDENIADVIGEIPQDIMGKLFTLLGLSPETQSKFNQILDFIAGDRRPGAIL